MDIKRGSSATASEEEGKISINFRNICNVRPRSYFAVPRAGRGCKSLLLGLSHPVSLPASLLYLTRASLSRSCECSHALSAPSMIAVLTYDACSTYLYHLISLLFATPVVIW
ncbi:hypothetical protein GCK32_022611 [Trichostrongylus colubriformis]|uniref:Uncharacterized protein n=1 Tax=Trichostrongylus colubriformis TaxID=6319 RepID=A0AAN8IG92_TRICO